MPTKVQINEEDINQTIHQGLKKVLSDNQQEIILSFTDETQKQLRTTTSFGILKKRVNDIYLKLVENKENNFQDFISAYEIILQARKFFLGEKGAINYTFLFSINNEIREVKLDSLTFSKLLMQQGQQILKISKDSLRFRRAGVVAALLPKITVNLQTGKQTITLEDNTQVHIQSASAFNKKLSQIRSIAQRFFGFNIETHITKRSYHFEITSAFGGAEVQTVYSAVGKYAYDELDTKREIISQEKSASNLDSDVKGISSTLNTGNLSEIYALYKNRYNQGHDRFSTTSPNKEKYRYVKGMQLFPIFKQVKANTDAFYQGGDILQDQIKSFLKDAPSLTRLSTLKIQIQRLNNILFNPDKEKIKEEVAEMFIKKQPDVDSALYDKESVLIDQLTQYLKSLEFDID